MTQKSTQLVYTSVYAVGACVTIKLSYIVQYLEHNLAMCSIYSIIYKECYYSITHTSAPPSHGSHVPPGFEWLPTLLPQVSITGLHKDGPPTPTSQPPQSILLLLGGV